MRKIIIENNKVNIAIIGDSFIVNIVPLMQSRYMAVKFEIKMFCAISVLSHFQLGAVLKSTTYTFFFFIFSEVLFKVSFYNYISMACCEHIARI